MCLTRFPNESQAQYRIIRIKNNWTMESINLALKYFGLRAERAVAIGIHVYAIFYHIRTHTEPQPPPQRKKKQCAKSINEMRWNEMHSRFFPNLFFLSSFSFCCCEERGKKKRISSVTAAFLSLRNTNISLLCFLGTVGRWREILCQQWNLLEWFHSNGIVFHSSMNSKQTKPNEFFSILKFFLFAGTKRNYINRLVR